MPFIQEIYAFKKLFTEIEKLSIKYVQFNYNLMCPVNNYFCNENFNYKRRSTLSTYVL